MSNNLSLRNVAIGYPTRRHSSRKVAEGLCATAPASTLTCIIGRNGAGKSTLLRSIAQLQQSLEGKMTLGNKDISDFSREELARRLSIVLTHRPDAENMTVGELVQLGRAPYTGFWGQLSDNDRLAADRALRMVGIEHMKHRRLCSLSDGECQKAMIAKSLAQDTPVILLDEPTAFLDFPGLPTKKARRFSSQHTTLRLPCRLPTDFGLCKKTVSERVHHANLLTMER